MALNRSGIEWCDYTLNPLPFCSRNCWYCYRARSMARLDCPDCRANRPHAHLDRLDALTRPTRRPGIVFVGSMGDIFDPRVRPEWQAALWEAVEKSPHQVVIATKSLDGITPETFPWFGRLGRPWPPNLWLLISAEDQARLDQRMAHALSKLRPGRLGVSLEPALGPYPQLGKWWLDKIRWVVFGGLSGSVMPPSGDWTSMDSLRNAQAHWAREVAGQVAEANRRGYTVALFVKQKPVRLPTPAPRVQEWPPEMLGQALVPKQMEMF